MASELSAIRLEKKKFIKALKAIEDKMGLIDNVLDTALDELNDCYVELGRQQKRMRELIERWEGDHV